MIQMRAIVNIVAVLVLSATGIAQDLKDSAKVEFQRENFAAAVSYLETYLESHQGDSEAWEELATCLHFRSYDSTPFLGDYSNTSGAILKCLKKALALDPNRRSCYELIGSEYGARAVRALRHHDWDGFLESLSGAQQAGAFPEWLLEYSENVIRSCAPNAILFAGGDADVFPVWYCQFIRGVRTDVTLVPVTLLERPWFLLLLKTGGPHGFRPLKIAWTPDQILDTHPFKWTKLDIRLEVPLDIRTQFQCTDTTFVWALAPDLERDGRTFLSVSRGAMRDIILANKWERPIHFSFGCQPWMLVNLDDHLRVCAITRELVPFAVKRAQNDIAFESTLSFLNDSSRFRKLSSVVEEDLPGTSALLTGYRVAFLRTCGTLLQSGQRIAALELLERMEKTIPQEILPISDGFLKEKLRLQEEARPGQR